MMNFTWIDDDPKREKAAKSLETSLNVNVKFIDASKEDSEGKLSEFLDLEEPDLIIIDHNLADITSGIFRKGSTVATFIREKWFDCPIISISGNIVEVDSQQRALYLDLFPIEKISDYYTNIDTIATSFKKMRANRPGNVEEFLVALKTPEDDKLNLSNVLPMTLKHDFSNKSLLVEIAHWIKFVLLKRPGFLLNKIWVSTLLGIKEESFYKVCHHFEDARYRGHFSNDNEQRWWRSSVLERIYELVDSAGHPWEKGRYLPEIDMEDFSYCYVSNEPFPETVAYIDSTMDAKEVAIKIKYSHLHPDYESLLNFEDIRLMTPA